MYPKWPLKKWGTMLLNSIWMFSLVGPFVTVAVITIERYITIVSFRARAISGPSNKVALIITAIWIYSLLLVAFMAAFFTKTAGEYYEWNVSHLFYYPYLGIHIVIPFVLIIVLYIRIIAVAHITRRGTIKHTPDSMAETGREREMKLTRTIGIVIGLLFAVWVPVLVLEYFYAVGTKHCWVQMAGPISVWLTCANGMINPLLYNFRNRQIQRAVRALCCKNVNQDGQNTMHIKTESSEKSTNKTSIKLRSETDTSIVDTFEKPALTKDMSTSVTILSQSQVDDEFENQNMKTTQTKL